MSACESCGAELPASAISNALRAARCARCGALCDLDRGGGRGTPARPLATVAAPLPPGWSAEEGMTGLVIRWRWFTLQSLIMIPFTLFWNGVLVGMATGVTGGFQHPERLLIGLVVPHVWVGIGLIYWTIAQLVNATTIEAGNGRLVVRKGPLPWRGNRELGVADLEQLFVVEKQGNRGSRSFELCAVLRDGRNQVILSGLESLDQGRFLESRLEQRLGIDDRRVDGEVPR